MTNSQIIKYILVLFTFSRLILLLLTFYGLSIIPHYAHNGDFLEWPAQNMDFWQRWANWDGGHFRGIAERGYLPVQTAFFPVYPGLIKLLMFFKFNSLWAGLIISQIATIVALFFLYKLVLLDFGEEVAKKTVLLLLIFPTSFYLSAVYSESTFLALALAAFFLSRQKKLFGAFFLAGLSTITRLIGISVVLAIFLERKKIFTKDSLWVLISFLPLILYMIYLQNFQRDFLAFVSVEKVWQRTFSFPWNPVFAYINYLYSVNFLALGGSGQFLIELLFFMLAAILLIFSFLKLRISYSIYFLIALLLPLFSGTLVAIHRYILIIFPLFIVLALIKNELIYKLWLIFSLLFLGIFSVLFINGYWVS